MFENTVRNAAYPLILELLEAFEHALAEVDSRAREDHKRASKEADVAGLATNAALLSALSSLTPAIQGMVQELERQHKEAGSQGAVVHHGKRRRG